VGFSPANPTRINEAGRSLPNPNIHGRRPDLPDLPGILSLSGVRQVLCNPRQDRFLTDTRVRAVKRRTAPIPSNDQGAATAIVSVSGTLLAG
jgi:hypothetical protein